MFRNRSLPPGAALTVELLSAYLANHTVAAHEVPDLIRTTKMALIGATEPILDAAAGLPFIPAVSVRKSLASSSHILSMIDGKPYRTLRRHLAAHRLTPEGYKARYNLPADYPIVAPDYAAYRRALAQSSALGRKTSARNIRGDEAASFVAPPTVERATAEVRAQAPDEAASKSNANALSLKAQESGPERKGSSPVARHAPTSSPAQTQDPVQQGNAISSEAKTTKADSNVARTSQDKSSVTVTPPRRNKLSLFEARADDNQDQSSQTDIVTSTADPRTSDRLNGPSRLIITSATASGEQTRLATSDRPAGPTQKSDDNAAGTSTRLKLMEAITRKQAVKATYNATVIKLAPHQIFARRDELYLTALNLSKNWRADEERRLGQFKLTGLKEVKLLDEVMSPLASYDGTLPRPEDILILSI